MGDPTATESYSGENNGFLEIDLKTNFSFTVFILSCSGHPSPFCHFLGKGPPSTDLSTDPIPFVALELSEIRGCLLTAPEKVFLRKCSSDKRLFCAWGREN